MGHHVASHSLFLSTPEENVEREGKLKMIGAMGIEREQELGHKMHPDYWGKGYMSEALAAFLKIWFALPGQHCTNTCSHFSFLLL